MKWRDVKSTKCNRIGGDGLYGGTGGLSAFINARARQKFLQEIARV